MAASKPTELTASRVRELLDYDPETGVFRHRRRHTRYAIGDVAGCKAPTGYLVIRIDYRLYAAHRLAWLWVYGEFPAQVIDHANGDRADNRLSNLRHATSSQNNCNRGAQSNNTTGFKGVNFDPRRRKFRANICLGRNQKWLGYFDNAEAAYSAYCAAAEKLHGEFARVAARGLT